jgi:ribosomal RNA-processing protein 36
MMMQRKEREAVKAGKGAYFQKRSEKQRQKLMWQYQELKATGRLERYMAKRRKKNAMKDHRYVPASRRSADT